MVVGLFFSGLSEEGIEVVVVSEVKNHTANFSEKEAGKRSVRCDHLY